MALPVPSPIEPMLCALAHELPTGDGWLYEPKWDGFRALVFRDGDELVIQSRDRKPLGRYFPELDGPLRASLPPRIVLDGEIVIATGDALDFEALLLRIHPARSRVELLAAQHPASYVAWDVLALGDDDLRALPQAERRARLEAALAGARPPVLVTPITRDRAVALDWFSRFEGAGLDGVIAKPASAPYQPGKRAMVKVKHARTADCVVAGFRWYKDAHDRAVGSLLLGLHDDAGVLHHVGVCSAFSQKVREQLVVERGASPRVRLASCRPGSPTSCSTSGARSRSSTAVRGCATRRAASGAGSSTVSRRGGSPSAPPETSGMSESTSTLPAPARCWRCRWTS